MEENTSIQLLRENFYFDIHGHKEKLLPRFYKIIRLGRVPKDIKLGEVPNTNVNGFVVCAIGDPNSFRLFKTDPFKLIKSQIEDIKERIRTAGGILAKTYADFERAIRTNKPIFVLGIEGGDFIEDDLTRVEYIFNEGVRVLVPVHFSKNSLGSIALGFGNRELPHSAHTGLTQLGREVIRKANELGIIIDLSHADEKTLTEAIEVTTRPVICSHTGPRNIQNYPRYISNEAIEKIASTDGIIGMWPFFDGKWGIRDINTFIEYAKYLKELVGSEHLGIGSDINGVPGNMTGYTNLYDAHKIIQALSLANFSEEEVKMVIGLNFLRIFKKVVENV